jgi:hypothetical protein
MTLRNDDVWYNLDLGRIPGLDGPINLELYLDTRPPDLRTSGFKIPLD